MLREELTPPLPQELYLPKGVTTIFEEEEVQGNNN